MNAEQQAEFARAVKLQAMVACALIEMEGMKAENAQHAHRGCSIAYGEESFNYIVRKYGIDPRYAPCAEVAS